MKKLSQKSSNGARIAKYEVTGLFCEVAYPLESFPKFKGWVVCHPLQTIWIFKGEVVVMWVFWRDDDEEIKIGYFEGTTLHEQMVVKYTDENVLKAMWIVNYLNGGAGRTILIGRNIDDAGNENQD